MMKYVINELAPRPHNSGHYSIEACNISQFHQHMRAVCGWPLREPKLWTKTVMVNILGQHVIPLTNRHFEISKLVRSPIWKSEAKRIEKWDMLRSIRLILSRR